MASVVTVSAVSCPRVAGEFDSPQRRVNAGSERMLEWIDQAAADKPDLIVLPEAYPWIGLPVEDRLATARLAVGKPFGVRFGKAIVIAIQRMVGVEHIAAELKSPAPRGAHFIVHLILQFVCGKA